MENSVKFLWSSEKTWTLHKNSVLTCQMVFVARIYGVVCLSNVQIGKFQFSPKRFLLIKFLFDFLQNFVNGCELSKFFSYPLRYFRGYHIFFNHFCHFLKNHNKTSDRTLVSCGSVCFCCLIVNYKQKIHVLLYDWVSSL